MTKQIIYILFFATTLYSYGQETKNERQISVGVYVIGFPTKYETKIYAGALLDISLKDNNRLYSSSSINYSGFYNNPRTFHNISITSGLSWKLQMKKLFFRPGIQLGYLYQNRDNGGDFLFHGVFVRLSNELTYTVNKFEYGLQFNAGIGYGPTRYYGYYPSLVQNKFGIMGGFGLEIKYTLFD